MPGLPAELEADQLPGTATPDGGALQRPQWPEWQARHENASFPTGRIGRADEVAATFLLSSECPMLTGAALTIDGAALSA